MHFRFFLQAAHLFSAFILIQLICTTISLSCCMFQADMVSRNYKRFIRLNFKIFEIKIQAFGDSGVNFLEMMFGLIFCAANIFLYCYFGQLATDSYIKMADCLFESKWYNQPLSYQKNLIVMIQNAQQTIHYHGFNIAYLNLNNFCKVWISFFVYFFFIFE